MNTMFNSAMMKVAVSLMLLLAIPLARCSADGWVPSFIDLAPGILSRPAAGRLRRRDCPRNRDEVAEERRRLEEEIARALDQLAAEFHVRLPRGKAKAIGAIYARYSSRFQHSIVDQVRALLEAALREGIYVPREHICFDLAVSGCKERRPGLQQLRSLLDKGVIQVLLVFTTNRLYRKTYKALQFVEEEVIERGIRCLFVKSGVDSSDEKRWRMLLQMHAMTDEFVLGMYADNVRAAHEGLFAQELVWGTITYGYRPRVVPGTPTRRKRARSKYEIDPVTAKWVRKVFTWYIRDGLSLAAIIRRLNDENAPLGPKAVSGRWTRLAVIKLLSNPRYRGCWEYGRSKNVWQSKKDYSRQVPREQPLRQAQFEDLRLVSDEQWYQAQKRLAEDSGASGRHPRDGDRKSRPRLLNGLFFCQEHGRRLYVGGAHGHMMFCPVCQGLPAEKRALYSLLNRKLALRLTCEKLAQLIRPNTALVQEVMAACEQEILRAQQPNPAQLSEARALHEKLSRQVKFILDNLGDSEEDRQEAETTLRRVRAERARVAALAAQLEEAARRPAVMPTAEEIEELLTHLGEILASAGVSETEEEVGAVRQVVKLLTGGRIELVQQGERRSHGGWLQGRFRLRVLPYLVNECTGQVTEDTDGGPEITIDYRTPTSAESWAEKVKALYDQGLLIKAIADQLGINRNLARLALACWSEKHGQPLPDGRSRRSTLDQQYLMLPLYQDIADRVMELYNQGEPLGNIATALNCDPNTVTKAVAYWHEIRGLPVPDGRTRRKSLSHPTSADPQKQDGEIAST